MPTADQCSHHTSWRTWLPSSHPKWTDALGTAAGVTGEVWRFIWEVYWFFLLLQSSPWDSFGFQFKNQVERLGFLASKRHFWVPWLPFLPLTGPPRDWKWRCESAADCIWWARGGRFLWPEGAVGWYSDGDGISFHCLGSRQRRHSAAGPCLEWQRGDDSEQGISLCVFPVGKAGVWLLLDSFTSAWTREVRNKG